MKYSILIIESENASDYWDSSADGVRFNNIEKYDLDRLMELALNQNFSVLVQKDEEGE